ncbi:hypothetical protein SSSM5_032 [Synechococcus phage S-SSM5]|uniref:Uncharacterized protein n=1 Tax=Synechococcus phage S-SSM5 TaxID=445685 RepID=E3SK72_9CAUD|nr:hypothetical protein SSSM5_032 [Synechococcus phage S-SSM5]ADO98038.1 hypothetical protein SSSM5_032 [Synechococcus phage S-SSM5]
MSKKTFKNKKGDEWSFEKTTETEAAIKRLHDNIREQVRKLESDTAPDYGVGK